MAEVRFEGVGKTYAAGDRPAVSGFDLTVGDGEFLVLVGPSGCGKSTSLRMVAGLEEPTEGRIFIGEKDVTHLPPKERDIAMVFQNYALYPHMTVRENLSFALKLRGCAKAEIKRRVDDAAAALGLGEYMERLPKALSGGQRQRVALGRAIVREPAVFLFDEPLSNLDAKMRVEMRAEIIRLHNRLGATMIYVTHDQTEAMTMGERIVVMKDGRIQQIAAPMELYERPANPFVASFIGTPPMNLIKQPDGRTLGIRPENVKIKAATDAESPNPQAPVYTVDFIEPLGPETLVHLAPGGIIVRQGGFADIAPGAKVTLDFNLEKAVWF